MGLVNRVVYAATAPALADGILRHSPLAIARIIRAVDLSLGC